MAEEETIPTTERLARALEALNDPGLAGMIAKARAGYYDDFKSPLTFPISQLVHDLRAAGHDAMARRVIDGEFDATPEESEAWVRTPEGQEAWRELLRGLIQSFRKKQN